MTAPPLPALLDTLDRLADQGALRRLDSALARHLSRLQPDARPALPLATALLAHMEGRGHTCLPLDCLADHLSPDLTAALPPLPATATDWHTALRACPAVVWHAPHAPDYGQPLVLTDHAPRLYLRRYWQFEQTLAQVLAQRARPTPAPRPESTLRHWLDRLFPEDNPAPPHGETPEPQRGDAEQSAPEASASGVSVGAFPPAAEPPQGGRGPLGGHIPVSEAPLRGDVSEPQRGDVEQREPEASASGTNVGASFNWQKAACALALRSTLTILTGGPGTGKTYTAARLLALLLATSDTHHALRIALAAPTGKAAARLRQSIDSALAGLQTALGDALDLTQLTQRIGPARTLHALLGARPDTRRFAHHAGNPLDLDILIVDEASMIHLELMAALLQALPPAARLILIGDKDQLASVEAGAVLGDLCRTADQGQYTPETARYLAATTGHPLPPQYLAPATAGAATLAQHTVMLRESRRFHGAIGQLAHAVNAGDTVRAAALLRDPAHAAALAHYVAPDPALLLQTACAEHGYRPYLRLLRQGPDSDSPEARHNWIKAVLRAYDRFRILCAIHQGDYGGQTLNRAVEHALAEHNLIRPTAPWYPGRPILVTRNAPELGVFNGDTGLTFPPAPGSSTLRVYFLNGEDLHAVATSRLAHTDTAYALTVHKSQGSEFTHTLLALAAHSGEVLTRELLYTGLTRARERFTLIEETDGLLATALAHPTRRASGLIL